LFKKNEQTTTCQPQRANTKEQKQKSKLQCAKLKVQPTKCKQQRANYNVQNSKCNPQSANKHKEQTNTKSKQTQRSNKHKEQTNTKSKQTQRANNKEQTTKQIPNHNPQPTTPQVLPVLTRTLDNQLGPLGPRTPNQTTKYGNTVRDRMMLI